jgi:hypothetical protein
MDPNSGNSGQQPQQAILVPMGEGWAPGVMPVQLSARPRRLRWGIGGAVVLCVVLISAAAAFMLSGAGGQKSLTAGVAPKNAIAFMEVRTDMPGDQRSKLADFMSHFPGFADRALFDTAMDQLLDKLTSSAGPDLTYSTAFKPWMQGEFSVSIVDEGPHTTSGVVTIFALKDRSAAESWVTTELRDRGTKMTPQSYNGTNLYSTGTGMNDSAYAVTDQDLFLGNYNGVKAALDARTNGSLADNPDYQAAMNSQSGDALARFYIGAKSQISAYIDSFNQKSQPYATGSGAIPTLGITAADIPQWVAGTIRSESERMVVTVTMPRTVATNLSLGNHTSTLASVLPGNTVAVVEEHSIGKIISQGLPRLVGQTEVISAAQLSQLTNLVSTIGGLDWVGDGVEVVTKDGLTLSGGVVVQATDAATASTEESSITNLVTLSASTLKLTSQIETYKGVTITLINIPAGGQIKTAMQVALAVKDNLIVAGRDDVFVKEMIDTTASSSLASQADYQTAMGYAGVSNEGSFYVNVPAVEDQIGQQFSPVRWASDYKPYFDHVGGIAGSVIDGDTVTMRLVISAK